MPGAKSVMSSNGKCNSGTNSCDLFDDNRIFQSAQSGSAKIGRYHDTEKSKPCHFLNGFHRKYLPFIPFQSVWLDLCLGKIPRHLADRLLVFGKRKMKIIVIHKKWSE